MNNLRILVADDHEVVRHGLVSLIASHPGWEVCAEAKNGRVAVDKAKEFKPDVAILDIGMPILNGLEATRQILRNNPCVKVLILTITDAEGIVQAALHAGARGYILKSDAGHTLVASIQALQHGSAFFTARVAEIVLAGYLENVNEVKTTGVTLSTLTSREREILQLLAEGETTDQVASLLAISPRTAETHRSNIMRKLKVHSIVGLIQFAFQNGIMQLPTGATGVEGGAQIA